jgi:hypothetical protein
MGDQQKHPIHTASHIFIFMIFLCFFIQRESTLVLKQELSFFLIGVAQRRVSQNALSRFEPETYLATGIRANQ